MVCCAPHSSSGTFQNAVHWTTKCRQSSVITTTNALDLLGPCPGTRYTEPIRRFHSERRLDYKHHPAPINVSDILYPTIRIYIGLVLNRRAVVETVIEKQQSQGCELVVSVVSDCITVLDLEVSLSELALFDSIPDITCVVLPETQVDSGANKWLTRVRCQPQFRACLLTTTTEVTAHYILESCQMYPTYSSDTRWARHRGWQART